MSIISRITTWADGQTLFATDLNNEFNNLVNLLNNLDAASSTWANVKISSTATNPLQVTSSAATAEISTNCTGTNGTAIHTLKRNGTTYFTFGVDGASSNIFKFSTSSLGTGTAFYVPSTGAQVQFPDGSAGTPTVSFLNNADCGLYRSSNEIIAMSVNSAAKMDWTNGNIDALVPMSVSDGSVSTPGLNFSNDTDTGVYRSGSNDMTILTGGSTGAYLNLKANGDILTTQLAPLATNATGGFFFIPTTAGTPSGTPTTYTGQVPCIADTTASKLWIRFGGSWKSVALS